jgi:hypothetical protein
MPSFRGDPILSTATTSITLLRSIKIFAAAVIAGHAGTVADEAIFSTPAACLPEPFCYCFHEMAQTASRNIAANKRKIARRRLRRRMR